MSQYDLEILIRTKKVGDGLQETEKQTKSFTQSLKSVQGVALAAGAGLAAVGAAAVVAYKAINEGAALEAAAGKFDNLSASINTTGDALLGKMTAATKGMISEAELVAAGTDIMSLGLAKTEAGVVRMSAAVGALNLDMGVMALTLANDSTARLDALGLAMEDVANTKKELIDSGFVGDAFDEAVLIELEKKMVLLGDASLTTAGQLQVMETQWKNVTDAMKQNAAAGAGPVIAYLSENVKRKNLLIEAEKRGLVTSSQYEAVQRDVAMSLEINSGLVDDLAKRIEMHDAAVAASNEEAAVYLSYQQAVYDSLHSVAEITLEAGAGYETYTNAMIGAELQQEEFTASQLAGREAMEAQRIAAEAARAGFNSLTTSINNAKTPVSNLLEAQAELARASGVWVTTIADTSGEIAAINQQLAEDLNADQEKAYEEILGTVAEGSAEWLSAYDALQGDLTESQRNALIAQSADFQTANGAIGSAYTGNIQAAEEAQARIAEANAAISESYKQTAVDVLQARLAQTIEEDGLGAATAMIAFQESLGLITPEESAALQDIATKTQLITDTTNAMLDTYLEDGVLAQGEIDNLASAVELVGQNSTLTMEQIIGLSDTGTEKFVTLTEGALETTDQFYLANEEAGKLKDLLWGLPDKKKIIIELETVGSVPSGLGNGSGGTPPEGSYATGGMVPGAWREPVLIQAHGGERIIDTSQGGNVGPGGMGAMTNNFYISGGDPQQIAREVSTILARQTRLNRAARV